MMAKRVGTRPAAQWIWVAAFGIAMLYVGSTILTPLYPIYQHEFGFSELVVTEIYAIYVVGNLAVLFLFGRLSDQIGRRPTTLAAMAVTIVSALAFLSATGTAWLFPARVLNGFGAGLGAGALTAWIAELEPGQNRARAAVVASSANLAGLAFGGLMSGLLAAFAPWPLRSSYVVFLGMLAILMAVTWFVPETVDRPVRHVRELSLRPRIGVPRGVRLAFVAPAAVAFAAFALGGFYAALAPDLLARSLHQTAHVVVGGIVALFFGTASLTAVVTRTLKSRSAILAALGLLWLGLGLLVLSEAVHSMATFVLATMATGGAMALGYRGSLQIINRIAPEAQRAEVVSSYLLVCYSANALSAIGVGLLSLAMSATNAHRVLAIVLVLLASSACAIGLRYAQQATTKSPGLAPEAG
ncbi:MAG: MFS transporter [Rhodanobacteraceae bacterium]